jgi:hypothetical protein
MIIMDKEPERKSILLYLVRPWILESIFFFLVIWQESFRLSSRTMHKILPVSPWLQKYYYYNFGDFVNGFIIAFIIDGAINVIFIKKALYYKISGFQITKTTITILATLFSIVVVVVFELMQSASTTPDVKDIPAGVFGALFYLFIRMIALKLTSKYDV